MDKFANFTAWFSATFGPPAKRWFKAFYADPLMHVVTGVVCVAAAKVVMIFW